MLATTGRCIAGSKVDDDADDDDDDGWLFKRLSLGNAYRMSYVVCHTYHIPPTWEIQDPRRHPGRRRILCHTADQNIDHFLNGIACYMLFSSFYKDTPCIVSIQESQFAVGIWWTIQMPVWTFLLSNRRFQGRCLSSLARNKQPTLNPTANLIFRIVSCILQRFWCIGWVCGSLRCLCLYKSSRKWLKPQSDRLTGQVGSCLRSLFWRSPIAKICSFTMLHRCKQILWWPQTPLQCSTRQSHHFLSSSLSIIIMHTNNDNTNNNQQHLGKLNPSLGISDYFVYCIRDTLTLSCVCIQNHLVCISYVRFTLVFANTTLYSHMICIHSTDTHWHLPE